MTEFIINNEKYVIKGENDDICYGDCLTLIESFERVMKLFEEKKIVAMKKENEKIIVSALNKHEVSLTTREINKVELLSTILGEKLIKKPKNLDVITF